jgi:hypothetical protein
MKDIEVWLGSLLKRRKLGPRKLSPALPHWKPLFYYVMPAYAGKHGIWI